MKLLFRIAIAFILLSLVAGCSSRTPIMNVEQQAIQSNLSQQQVRVAIIQAASARGWIISDDTPNELVATINVRTHKAVIRIPYSANDYSIIYVESSNLDYKKGKIHGNYNRWINNLNSDIRALLQIESLNN